MKLAIVYFNTAKVPDSRKHHRVYDFMLRTWAMTYRLSGTPLEPVLLTDRQTVVPACWPYSSVVIEDADPPVANDVLNKVGWIKGQAFEAVGKCVVMDLDAFIVRNVGELAELTCPIGMVKDPGAEQIWSAAVPEVGVKHNAGVVVLNESCRDEFRRLWNLYWPGQKHVTYFDELLFTIMTHRRGVSMPQRYNYVVQEDDEISEVVSGGGAKIVHYPGSRKHMIRDLMRLYTL